MKALHLGLILVFIVILYLWMVRGKKRHENYELAYGPNGYVPKQAIAPEGIDRQYVTAINSQYTDRHPVLAYQLAHDKGVNPASIGDPIRIKDVAGPTDMYGNKKFADALVIRPNAIPYEEQVFGNGPGIGPMPGFPQNVPVPMGALKSTNERYNKDMFKFSPMMTSSPPPPREREYPPTSPPWTIPTYPDPRNYRLGGSPPVRPLGTDFPYQTRPNVSDDFYRPYGPNASSRDIPFFGSVNAYAPFPEITNPWEKIGILTSTVKDYILNLYQRPIAPLQDQFEYQVVDKDGFVIKLQRSREILNGDIIEHVDGKRDLGPWRAHMYTNNKYIWM